MKSFLIIQHGVKRLLVKLAETKFGHFHAFEAMHYCNFSFYFFFYSFTWLFFTLFCFLSVLMAITFFLGANLTHTCDDMKDNTIIDQVSFHNTHHVSSKIYE